MPDPNVTTYSILVGNVISRWRKIQNFDQTALAQEVGVSQSTWSRIERGQIAITAEQLLRVADALGGQPTTILAEADRLRSELKNKENVEVVSSKEAEGMGVGAALLTAAAIGVLIAALSRK